MITGQRARPPCYDCPCAREPLQSLTGRGRAPCRCAGEPHVGGCRSSPGRGAGLLGWYALPMDTPHSHDEIHEMRQELHRLIDRLPDEALVALWRLVWRWVTERRGKGS